MIRKYGAGWGFDFRDSGGRRIRKRGYKTRIEAANALRRFSEKQDLGRSLSSLVRLWYDLHGRTLKDHRYRLSRTLAIVDRLGDPSIDDFGAVDWAHYRSIRLRSVAAGTVNHEQRYLSAVFAELVRLGHLQVNPIATVRQIRVRQQELSFLTLDQCRLLLHECEASGNPYCYAVALLCLATGARWGEAESITQSSLLPGKILYRDTKNGQSRAVPVSSGVLSVLLERGKGGPGRLFGSCRDAYRSAYGRAGFWTPGQLTHVLRHTFASHFMMAGGDILALQRILGHGSITMTMRYAHLSPDHLVTAVTLNPLALMGMD